MTRPHLSTRARRIALACALALACLAPWPASAAELVVSAAASLSDAFRDIGKRFEAARPGDKVVFNFAASDVLLAQIDKGAPADVFASADPETMDRAERSRRIEPATRRDFAANRLVIVVPVGAPGVDSMEALKKGAVKRVAMGSPGTVPAGRYARDTLRDAGVLGAVQPKLVLAQNVRQVLAYVARGEVDAGFVYSTDAAILPGKVVVSATLKPTRPVRYPIAVVAASREPQLAAAFVGFVAGSEGRAVLEHYGFVATRD
jgi:molybdate transport system substrate-binding protein